MRSSAGSEPVQGKRYALDGAVGDPGGCHSTVLEREARAGSGWAAGHGGKRPEGRGRARRGRRGTGNNSQHTKRQDELAFTASGRRMMRQRAAERSCGATAARRRDASGGRGGGGGGEQSVWEGWF